MTESPSTSTGQEIDVRALSLAAETIARVASSAKSRGASMAHKTAILKRHVDVGRPFGPYTWDTLPTRYLAAYFPADKPKNMDALAWRRSGQRTKAEA